MVSVSLRVAVAAMLLGAAGCAAPPHWWQADSRPTTADTPLSAEDLAGIAEKFADQGRTEKARQLCAEALRRNPTPGQTARLNALLARCEPQDGPKTRPVDDAVREALAALKSAESSITEAANGAESTTLGEEPSAEVVTAAFPPATEMFAGMNEDGQGDVGPAALVQTAAATSATFSERDDSFSTAAEWIESCACQRKPSAADDQPAKSAPPAVLSQSSPTDRADAVAWDPDGPPETDGREWEPVIQPVAKQVAKPKPPAAGPADPQPLVELAAAPVFEKSPTAIPSRTAPTVPGLWAPVITPGAGSAKPHSAKTQAGSEWEAVP